MYRQSRAIVLAAFAAGSLSVSCAHTPCACPMGRPGVDSQPVERLRSMTQVQLEAEYDRGVQPQTQELAEEYVGVLLFPEGFDTLGPVMPLVLNNPLQPWKGKRFYRQADGSVIGRNVLIHLGSPFTAYPMRPVPVNKGVRGRPVLRLDYRDRTNPPVIQRVFDELVSIDGGVMLGRAYYQPQGGGKPLMLIWFALIPYEIQEK